MDVQSNAVMGAREIYKGLLDIDNQWRESSQGKRRSFSPFLVAYVLYNLEQVEQLFIPGNESLGKSI